MMIERISGKHKGRCRVVVNNGIVYAVATDTTSAKGISEQTERALETFCIRPIYSARVDPSPGYRDNALCRPRDHVAI